MLSTRKERKSPENCPYYEVVQEDKEIVNFLASENWRGRVHFEGHLPKRRVLSKFSAPHPSPPSWTSGQVAWLPMRIMREPGYDFNNKKMAESFTGYNMEFGFKILKKHVVVIC